MLCILDMLVNLNLRLITQLLDCYQNLEIVHYVMILYIIKINIILKLNDTISILKSFFFY